jgi:NADPH2:quinone reductase
MKAQLKQLQSQFHRPLKQLLKMSTFTRPATQKAILFHETNPDRNDYSVLKYEDISVPSIAKDEVLIKNKFTGVNFIEQYFRIGLYPSVKPYVLGREAVGVIVEKGPEVKGDYEVGDLVTYGTSGTFAQYTKFKIPSGLYIYKLPKDTDAKTQIVHAGLLVQGLTALTFITESYNVQKGDYIFVHAAAGGVGQILVQLLKLRGANVIASASSDAKLELVKSLGADLTINSNDSDIADQVLKFTNNQGVAAVYDGVGKATFDLSLSILARKGTFISFGNASGAVPPFPISILTAKNVKILRPSLFNYLATQEEWEKYSSELRQLVEDGKLKIAIDRVYDLKDYAEAAKYLESRASTGKLVLRIPE